MDENKKLMKLIATETLISQIKQEDEARASNLVMEMKNVPLSNMKPLF